MSAAYSKKLVIVESPTKVKTISKILGNQYIVKSSVGHIRDLPKGSSSKRKTTKKEISKKLTEEEKIKQKHEKWVNRLGIDPLNDWKAIYEVMPGKEKVIKELKSIAKDCEKIILATDMDREGEAIAWHLKELLGSKLNYERIIFSEITKNAILSSIDSPKQISMDRVHAQQTRRFLDRLVGFCVSPILWKRVAPGLSAGRVQSIALRLICEKEQAIRVFIAKEYWRVDVNLITDKSEKLSFSVDKYKGKEFKPVTQKETEEFIKKIEKLNFKISDIKEKKTKQNPAPPFVTSTLQQAASSKLGYNIKRTMLVAQHLYEKGLITYMRTDATQVSKEAIASVRKYIKNNYGNEFLPESPNYYKSRANAQEAHEAIRPTRVDFDNNSIDSIEERNLYNLIKNQFIASQMPPAQFMNTKIIINDNDFELKCAGRVMLFEGFTKIMPLKCEDPILPKLKINDILTLDSIKPTQHFTRPPARYTEALLVQELEKRGIGRPSTYVSIISTIQERGYVSVHKRRFFAEKIGEVVNSLLQHDFSDLMRYEFTANLEEKLDSIADGKIKWKHLLDEFYEKLQKEISISEEVQYRIPFAVSLEELKCSQCSKDMILRYSSNGLFIGCSGYNNSENSCKNILSLTLEENYQNLDETDEESSLRKATHCKKCNSVMDSYLAEDNKHKLIICRSYPLCLNYILESGDYSLQNKNILSHSTLACHKCNGEMKARKGRFGSFFACNLCNTTRKMLKNGEPAPITMDPIELPSLKCFKVNDHFVLREGGSGLFLAASKYPKHRETKSPTVEELQLCKDKLPDYLQFLALAPKKDDKNNPTVICFSKKTKSYYISSIANGKRTKFVLYFINNKWTVAKG